MTETRYSAPEHLFYGSLITLVCVIGLGFTYYLVADDVNLALGGNQESLNTAGSIAVLVDLLASGSIGYFAGKRLATHPVKDRFAD